jgi:uncharacterized protein (DUF433 family)
MPRTSTARRHGYVCPLCDRPLSPNDFGTGWVRHQAGPDVERILSNPDKRGQMSDEDVHYLQFYRLCPFERGEKDTVGPPPAQFAFLGPRQGSHYRQWFVNGKGIRAETLYRQTLGDEARTPEEVAEDYGLPVEAVREAVEYCEHNEDLLREERDADWASIRARGLDKPLNVPAS